MALASKIWGEAWSREQSAEGAKGGIEITAAFLLWYRAMFEKADVTISLHSSVLLLLAIEVLG